ncbi:MAG: tRNA dimethylallyltransferase, partial [Bacteroidota bacterium]
HLIDIADAGSHYNVYEFQRDFLLVYDDIRSRKKVPVLCGGTGLYIEAVTSGYKLISVPVNRILRERLSGMTLSELSVILAKMKKLHNTTDIDTKKRAIRAIEIEQYYSENPPADTAYPDINSLYIGIAFDRETRRRRITERLKLRLENGMIDEAEKLLKSGLTTDQLIYYGLEYKYLAQYLAGFLSYDEMFTGLETAIHRFAKRQMTWFRGMERKGIKIHWIDGTAPMEEKLEHIIKLMV